MQISMLTVSVLLGSLTILMYANTYNTNIWLEVVIGTYSIILK